MIMGVIPLSRLVLSPHVIQSEVVHSKASGEMIQGSGQCSTLLEKRLGLTNILESRWFINKRRSEAEWSPAKALAGSVSDESYVLIPACL